MRLGWALWTSTNSQGRFVQHPSALLAFLVLLIQGELMDFDGQVFIVGQGSLCELLLILAALGFKSQTAAASWALRCRGLLHSVLVAELLWPGAQLYLMNYPKDQLGYFDSSFVGVVTEPGGLAVVSLRAAISGMWRAQAATAHPRMRQQALMTCGYFSCSVLPGGLWPGKGFAGGSVHRGDAHGAERCCHSCGCHSSPARHLHPKYIHPLWHS